MGVGGGWPGFGGQRGSTRGFWGFCVKPLAGGCLGWNDRATLKPFGSSGNEAVRDPIRVAADVCKKGGSPSICFRLEGGGVLQCGLEDVNQPIRVGDHILQRR